MPASKMPGQAADLEEALNKKGGLTLSQLANYDDLITDALVDRVYFWSSIRKLKANYHACRGVQETDVCKILQQYVIINKDSAEAQAKLLQLAGIAKYHKNLKTEDEKEHFLRHLRKYINMYLPDCPFEVGTTNRYTITTAEAAIIARKPIRKGEPIKYLSGIQVEMTEKEEKELSSRTDFSIVLSSRRKRPSLFLGPARFANHDCGSNAKLNTTGPHGIHIVACKDIAVGQEITVTYGDDYFGEDNCECLCATCEGLQRNGWDPNGPPLNEDSSDDESETEEAPTKRKKTISAGPTPDSKTMLKRKRVDNTNGENRHTGPEIPSKRPRGRPRKHPRPEHENGEKPIMQSASGSRSGPHQTEVNLVADGSDEGEQSKQNHQTHRAAYLERGTRRASSSSSASSPSKTVKYQPRGGILREKVRRLFESVADRRPRTSDSGLVPIGQSSSKQPSGARLYPGTVTEGISDYEVKIHDDGTDSDDSLHFEMNNLTRFYRMTPLSHSDTEESIERKQSGMASTATRSETGDSDPPWAMLQRSRSSLRHVVNASSSEKGASNKPVQQASQPDPPRRKRGRPRKYPLREDVVRTDSNSPPSSGMENSSSASLASSATSVATTVDMFAAGAIAQAICDMYTNSLDREDKSALTTSHSSGADQDKLSPKKSVSPSPNKGNRKASAINGAQGRSDSAHTDSHAEDKPDPSTPVLSIENFDPKTDRHEDLKRGPARTPGDYYLCRTLLTTAYHRWVECRNCDQHFVQGDAYLTRIACPRCERHSKLYGFYWPKTDREGKNDKDKRVLDHRTIHRFIDPEDERNERKGRKTLAEVVRDQELYGRSNSESPDKAESGYRSSPRRSDSLRKVRMIV